MPCQQVQGGSAPESYTTGPFARLEDCLESCKEGACCEQDGTCGIKPQCQCKSTGQTFRGIGTVCSPNPCCGGLRLCVPSSIVVTNLAVGATFPNENACDDVFVAAVQAAGQATLNPVSVQQARALLTPGGFPNPQNFVYCVNENITLRYSDSFAFYGGQTTNGIKLVVMLECRGLANANDTPAISWALRYSEMPTLTASNCLASIEAIPNFSVSISGAEVFEINKHGRAGVGGGVGQFPVSSWCSGGSLSLSMQPVIQSCPNPYRPAGYGTITVNGSVTPVFNPLP